MDARYSRNVPAVSEEEQRLLGEKRVLVAGCGGLGGYLMEYLVRLGVGHITAADGDVFEASNLNRQLLAAPALLGSSKAGAAAERAAVINPRCEVRAAAVFLDEANADELLAGQDLALDALDNVPARLILEDACGRRGIPLVHGAIEGWSAQIAVSPPGSGLLRRLYDGRSAPGGKSSLSFTPALCAALQCAEAVKLLLGREASLEEKLLLADLRRMEFDTVMI